MAIDKKKQEEWFEKLTRDREDSARTLEKPSMRGIKNSVVEKYSDQAHFIYELLQNANDAKATKSSFQLTAEGLYFRHNGKTLFSISNPDTEDQDKEKNKLGHINSITAIANSNKTESSIGKFGVGFKAVFQYTETPHIYDPNFQFKIDRFIIPVKLDEDLPDRLREETVFYFPFNKDDMPKEKAFADILEKLKKLVFPTLFLSNLQEVIWRTENETGEYTKKGKERKQSDGITYEKIELYQQIGLQQTQENLYLFTCLTQQNHTYAIGYFLDDNGKLIPKQFAAFCFFPTKEATNLNFILHAPFLLTDSREGIKRSEKHNSEMVELLAQLAADSLLILRDLELIDDNIINIIPYKEKDFYSTNSYGYIIKSDPKFFAPFYEPVKEKFKSEALLPTIDENVLSENACWAEDKPLLNLFTDEQLASLIDDKNAKWVFRSLVRNQTREDNELRRYIEGCTNAWYEMSDLLRSLDSKFIENQTDEWLHGLYEYLSKNNSYWSDVKTKPIFLNKERKAVPAFEKTGSEFHEILFLPSDNLNTSTKTILPTLLENEKSEEFIKSFGIKQPSLKDEIYNNILPLYEIDESFDTEPHFKMFFTYWKESGRPEDFIRLIKNKEFISYKTSEDETTYRGKANEIYFPSEELTRYFGSKPDAKFVDLEDYYGFITDEKERRILKDFLLKLGVAEDVRVKRKEKDLWNGHVINFSNRGWHERGLNGFDKNITVDGLEEALTVYDSEKSKFIWNKIVLPNTECIKGIIQKATRQDYSGSTREEIFSNNFGRLLIDTAWLPNKEEVCKPSELSLNDLPEGFILDEDLAVQLGMKVNEENKLTEAERIAQKFESEEEAEEARKALEEKREKEKRKAERKTSGTNTEVDTEDLEGAIESLENLSESVSKPKTEKEKTNTLPDFDEDEELAKGIEDLKKQLEIKKSRVDLAENINNSVKYSYDWFKAYLQLLTTYGEKQDTQKQKSISFQEIKPYKADNKYFLLCGASSYISPEIENADDFKVSLVFGSGKRENITVEGVSKKGQDLLIYCREPLSSNTLSRLSNIFKVEINFTPVIDLLDRLYKAFTNDNYIDEWENIQEAIPSLNFIYGPPGTGKTTTLCNKINDILAADPNAKFLVLTPTNKAADVVCKKLWEINEDVYSVRLSHPTDYELENLGEKFYRNTLDRGDMGVINVVASTIHRLPYFDIQNAGLLFQYQWDYVIFDEASMTGLHYMVFAILSLFKSNPETRFIVAGDPKQIPPVNDIGEKELENFDFQDENIYKMMNLESFNPDEQIIREIDVIQNLDTQYRSIPQIGQLFSELSYSSLLKHYRATNRKEVKALPEKFKRLISSNITFIDIPLDKDNSIYKVNKLFYSSYHTYCAILVSEIIKYFDSVNKAEQWTIGLIAPYKAQAILLNKLITSYGISENVKVFSDTVHGFQGDECDIVFFVCNPNNYFYSGHEKALLSKEYIYNVAISRAKDYLIVLHPYTAIQNNIFLNEIGFSYRRNFGNAKILNAKEIEMILFNEENYIENNSYVSGHDTVNVFGLSEMKYFIKANDTAIDIQLKSYDTSNDR